MLDLIRLLVPNWRPTATQVIWAMRIALVLEIFVLIGYVYGITLWNWLQLLIVPATIAVAGVAGAAWFAEQRAQDDALQAYFDQMGRLMLRLSLMSPQEQKDEKTGALTLA